MPLQVTHTHISYFPTIHGVNKMAGAETYQVEIVPNQNTGTNALTGASRR
jgi:hypothetical protein